MNEEKLKVMIVDDEEATRELIKMSVNWKELNLNIVAEASSAKEALENIDITMPDIVLTDVSMPGMDGIELSKCILENYPDIKVIIITAYDDFSYAKRGIKAGVCDYFLKPIDGKKIKEMLIKVKKRIKDERVKYQEFSDFEMLINENREYIKEKFLNELLYLDFEESILEKKRKYSNISFSVDKYRITCIELNIKKENENINDEKQKLIYLYACKKMVVEDFKEVKEIEIFFDNSNRIVILQSYNVEYLNIEDFLEKIIRKMTRRYFCDINIGIGNWYEGSNNIKNSYYEALSGIRYMIVVGSNQIVYYKEIGFANRKVTNIDESWKETFRLYVKSGLVNESVDCINKEFKKLFSQNKITIDKIRYLGMKIIIELITMLLEEGIEIRNEFEDRFEQILKIVTVPKLKDFVSTQVEITCEIMRNAQEYKTKNIVSNIKEYLIANIENEEISLKYMSKMFYLNKNYLSRLFKQKTGITFGEYHKKLRIEKAIELLKTTDMKVYEIGKKVGYMDANYFSTVFKQYTNMSISEYKKKINKE